MKRETNAQEWLRLAEGDRRVAHLLLQDGEYDACAFHCQQATEKLFKAIIVKRTNEPPPYIHDLRPLFRYISDLGIDGDIVLATNSLNAYYAATRYPLETVDPSTFIKPLAESAVRDMEAVFTWFLARVNFKDK